MICPADRTVDFSADPDDSTFTDYGAVHDMEESLDPLHVIRVHSVDDVCQAIMSLESHTESMLTFRDPETRLVCIRSFTIAESNLASAYDIIEFHHRHIDSTGSVSLTSRSSART